MATRSSNLNWNFDAHNEDLQGLDYVAFVWEYSRQVFFDHGGWSATTSMEQLREKLSAAAKGQVVAQLFSGRSGLGTAVHLGLFTSDFPKKSIVELSLKTRRLLKSAHESVTAGGAALRCAKGENSEGNQFVSPHIEYVTFEINWAATKKEILDCFNRYITDSYWDAIPRSGKRASSKTGRPKTGATWMTKLKQLGAYRLLAQGEPVDNIASRHPNYYSQPADFSRARTKVIETLRSEFGVVIK